jgi:hypothetical protein
MTTHMTGQFFRNVAGYPLGEVPELDWTAQEVSIAPGGLLYCPDPTVAGRMAGQTQLYQQVTIADALQVARTGGTIVGWTGSIGDLEAAVKQQRGTTRT